MEHALPVLVAGLSWWAATGAILWLDGLPRRTFRASLILAAGAMAAGFAALAFVADRTDPLGAYLGFFAALVIWAWHEMAFLMGLVTGPRRSPCPPEARGWRRFRLAAATLIHHELALVAGLAGIIAVTWGAPNQTGTLTFALLFALRLSAKLNIFFGAPHVSESFLPAHLNYLKSYFRKGPATAFLPLSIAAIALLCAGLGAAVAGAPDAGSAAGAGLLCALAALGLLEHLAMLAPLPERLLWGWAFSSHRAKR